MREIALLRPLLAAVAAESSTGTWTTVWTDINEFVWNKIEKGFQCIQICHLFWFAKNCKTHLKQAL